MNFQPGSLESNENEYSVDLGLYEPKIHSLVNREEVYVQHNSLEDLQFQLKQTLTKVTCEEKLLHNLLDRVEAGESEPHNPEHFEEDVNQLIEHVKSDPNLYKEILKGSAAKREQVVGKIHPKLDKGKRSGKEDQLSRPGRARVAKRKRGMPNPPRDDDDDDDDDDDSDYIMGNVEGLPMQGTILEPISQRMPLPLPVPLQRALPPLDDRPKKRRKMGKKQHGGDFP